MPLELAKNAAQIVAQLLALPTGPFELPSVGVSAMLAQRLGALAGVALTQRHALVLCRLDQFASGLVVQPRVGRVRDRLGLHRRVHRDFGELPGLDQLQPQAQLDRQPQQVAEQLLTHPVSPLGHAGWIDGQVVLEIVLAAEILPVRVLDPPFTHRLIALIERVLEVVQPDHQPRRQPRPTLVGIAQPHAFIDLISVDLVRQPDQRVLRIEDLAQPSAKQVVVIRGSAAGLHRSLQINQILQRIGAQRPKPCKSGRLIHSEIT